MNGRVVENYNRIKLALREDDVLNIWKEFFEDLYVTRTEDGLVCSVGCYVA